MKFKQYYRFLSYFLISSLILMNSVSAYSADKSITKNENTASMDSVSFIDNNRVYVPMLTITNTFGIYVKWDSDNQNATITKGSVKVMMNIDSKELICTSDKEVKIILMDARPISKDGVVYLPVRFLAEAFGMDVSWNSQSQSVAISEGEKVLSFTVGEKILSLSGGYFLKAYDLDNEFYFFYPVGGQIISSSDGLIQVEFLKDEIVYTISVANVSGETEEPPVVHTIESIKEGYDEDIKEGIMEGELQPVAFYGLPAYQFSGYYYDAPTAAITFVNNKRMCGMSVEMYDSEGADALVAASELFNELYPSLYFTNIIIMD